MSLFLVWLWLLVSSSLASIQLHFDRGSSAANATFSAYVKVYVTCASNNSQPLPYLHPDSMIHCPPWVRIDRVDGVADVTPFNSIINEAVSFRNSQLFPVWIQPRWGPTRLYYGGSIDNKPIPFVASGWSARYNGTLVDRNSSIATIYFNVTFGSTQWKLNTANLRPGAVRLTVAPTVKPDDVPSFDQVRFDRFVQTTDSKDQQATVPEFTTSFFYHQESGRGYIDLAFQQPGIYYYGATPSYSGRAGGCTAGGEVDGRPSPYPTAIVVRGPNGELNDTIPTGFLGPVHETLPLQSPRQFCVVITNVTLFAGGRLMIPLCRPDPKTEIPEQPAFVTINLPVWLSVAGASNETSNYPAVVNSTSGPIAGRYNVTFYNRRWTTYQDYVPLYFGFDLAAVGSVTTLRVAIHEQVDGIVAFQELTARAAATPTVSIPAEMMTSITWANEALFMEGSLGNQRYSSLGTSLQLGFNTIPAVSVNSVLAGSRTGEFQETRHAYAGNRTDPIWQQLHYGPELSGFHNTFSTLRTVPNATVLQQLGVPADRLKEEMTKWNNAYRFHLNTSGVDIAYDGWLFQLDVQEYCHVVNVTQADWIFADDEGWGDGYRSWSLNVAQSANANQRRLPGENDENLGIRMVQEMLVSWTNCYEELSPTTKMGYYGDNFPGATFAAAKIRPQPSAYGPMHYPSSLFDWLQGYKRALPVGAKEMLPWVTACTYGQMTAAEVFASMMHIYASGSTGFSFFIESCFDDLGKMLALSRSTAIMAPFYPLLLNGEPLAEMLDVVSVSPSVTAWSGVRNTTTLLMAVSVEQQADIIIEVELSGSTTTHTCQNAETGASTAMQQTASGTWTCTCDVPATTSAFIIV
eukprot:m.131083 g.131083  ORF g.131083 m.131083 type:complete len:860 (-) comp15898_c0_seq3:38-2617(-)